MAAKQITHETCGNNTVIKRIHWRHTEHGKRWRSGVSARIPGALFQRDDAET